MSAAAEAVSIGPGGVLEVRERADPHVLAADQQRGLAVEQQLALLLRHVRPRSSSPRRRAVAAASRNVTVTGYRRGFAGDHVIASERPRRSQGPARFRRHADRRGARRYHGPLRWKPRPVRDLRRAVGRLSAAVSRRNRCACVASPLRPAPPCAPAAPGSRRRPRRGGAWPGPRTSRWQDPPARGRPGPRCGCARRGWRTRCCPAPCPPRHVEQDRRALRHVVASTPFT